MKKILLAIFVFGSLCVNSQIVKVKDLPTTSTGTSADFIIKDDVAGIPGSTKKISVAAFKALYFGSSLSGTGTTGNYVKFTSSSTLGNALAKDSSLIFTLGSTKFLARRMQLVDGSQASGKIIQSDASGNFSWVTAPSPISGLSTNKLTKAGSSSTIIDS